jgi:molybdopterin molybdotransferase
MLELEQAVEKILAAVPPTVPESLSLAKTDGRILAETIRAGIDLPLFDTSSMDGYAVRSADVSTASQEQPARLKLIGKVAAGQQWTGELGEKTCVRLFTGSPLPRGSDAVVMQEDTRADSGSFVEVIEVARPWENVRLQGEDIKHGSVIAQRGEVLDAGRLMLLAATGCGRVSVGSQPRVGLLATGSELVEPPGTLSSGQIFESNRIGLAALVKAAGAVPKIFPIVADTLTDTQKALSGAMAECDILVTSGGVSVGEFDFIKPAIEALGGSLEFWKVAIKPGRPFVFGRAGGRLLLGLPGNPVSAFVTFLLLVRPALLRWQGANNVGLPRCSGILAEPLSNVGRRRHFIRVRMDQSGKVRSAGTQASHIFSSMASANGLLDVPPDTTLAAGTQVPVLRWS